MGRLVDVRAVMKCVWWLCAGSVCVWSALGCAGSQGEITNEISPDASFVTVDHSLNVHTLEGQLVEMTLMGERGDMVTHTPYHIMAATPDGGLLVLGNSNTDLFMSTRGASDSLHEVKAVHGRASGVAISPDGRTVAVSLHSDYNKPTKMGPEHTDDTIYLVDVATRDVRVLPATRKGWAMMLFWGEPGEIMMYWREPGNRLSDRGLALNVHTQARTPAEWGGGDQNMARSWHMAPKECDGVTLGQDELGLYTGDRQDPKYLVSIKGRKRGFHDHFDTIPSYHFAGDCNHVVFVHAQKVYVHQRSSGRTAYLGEGAETWYFPER